jgi:multisubunit Na+/H+ antiporter MnhG subunit
MEPWRSLRSWTWAREKTVALAEIFTPEFVIAILLLTGPVLCIFGLIDVVRRPDWAWQASGQSKTLWLVLNVVGIVLFFVFFSGSSSGSST